MPSNLLHVLSWPLRQTLKTSQALIASTSVVERTPKAQVRRIVLQTSMDHLKQFASDTDNALKEGVEMASAQYLTLQTIQALQQQPPAEDECLEIVLEIVDWDLRELVPKIELLNQLVAEGMEAYRQGILGDDESYMHRLSSSAKELLNFATKPYVFTRGQSLVTEVRLEPINPEE
jgi:hypothetical protein